MAAKKKFGTFKCYSGGKVVHKIDIYDKTSYVYSSLEEPSNLTVTTGFDIGDKNGNIVFSWRGDFSFSKQV